MSATSGNSMIFISSARTGPRRASPSKNRYAEKLLISKRFRIRGEKSIWIHANSFVDFFHPGSQIFSIPDPGSASKNVSILPKKLFPSSRKYDPGCSSRIRILIFYPPGFKKESDSGSARLHADPDPGLPRHETLNFFIVNIVTRPLQKHTYLDQDYCKKKNNFPLFHCYSIRNKNFPQFHCYCIRNKPCIVHTGT